MATNIDPTTGLVYQVKRPIEDKKYTINFDKILPSGVTVASVQSIAASPVGLAVEVEPLVVSVVSVSGTKIIFSASGGTDEEDYEVKVVGTDSTGDTVSDDVMMKVRKAGVK